MKKRARKKIPYLWVSTVNAHDASFIGVVLIRARSLAEARPMIEALRIMPPETCLHVTALRCSETFDPPETAINRLLAKQDILEIFPDMELVNGRGEPA